MRARALDELGVLLRLLRGQPRSGDARERLNAFYAPQAERYDAFRSRLLHGRAELIERLELQPGHTVVELGAGTGWNTGCYAALLPYLAATHLVDLCAPLLAQARIRLAGHGNVWIHEADAAQFMPPRAADRVYIAYALTMMPAWERVLENARRMLKPGGRIGVVDFHLPEPRPGDGALAALGRAFWRVWFAHDGVMLDGARLARLRASFEPLVLQQRRGRLPYLPGLKAPYYLFVGRR